MYQAATRIAEFTSGLDLKRFRWSAMARMRDKLIHHYRGVDLEQVYKAASVKIPRLLEFLRSQLPDDRGSQ